MQLTDENIVAMAVACIAEETGIAPKKLRVISFHEIQKSSLETYIEMNHIPYKKYELGDEAR